MQTELNRKPSTVYFSDIVGYTRLMGKDENAAFELMRENLALHQEILAHYQGSVIKELGDGILAVFDSSIDALNASLEIQKRCEQAGRYQLRIGLQSGEIIFDHGDIFGDAVNVASRIQSVGVPGNVLFSDRVCREILSDGNLKTTKLGSFDLKNVDHSLELFALANAPLAIPKRVDILGNIKYQERNPWKYRVGIGAILVLLAALLYSVFWADATWEKEKSVAVIPFRNLSDESFAYFPSALTENLIDQITKISSIKTISYATMKSFSDPEVSLDSVALATKVTTILRGEVEKLTNGVKISLRLVDVEDNKIIWNESYIREGEGIPLFQNDLAKEIARVLDARLTAEEVTQIGKGETTNPQAYDLFFKAKELYLNYDDSSFLAGIAYLKQAIALDSNYALAYTLLAKSYYQLGYSRTDSSLYGLSLDMSEKALGLEPNLAEGFSARGATYYDLGQITKAKNSFETALSYNPNSSEANGNLATVYFEQGNLLDAIRLQTKSASQNPGTYLPYQNLGWTYKILGKYTEAHEWFAKSLEKREMAATYELSAFSYVQQGKLDSALSQAAKLMKNTSSSPKELGFIYFYSNETDSAFQWLGREMATFNGGKYPRYSPVPIIYAYLLKTRGNSTQADSILNESILVKRQAIDLGYEDYYLPLDLASAYAIKNQPKESLKYLQMAYDRGWKDYFFTEFNPVFVDLKKDPEYLKILTKLQHDISQTNSNLTDASAQE